MNYNTLRGDDLIDSVIYQTKNVASVYQSELIKYSSVIKDRNCDIIEINNKNFLVKKLGAFIWISKIEHIYNMSLITYAWEYNTIDNNLFNQYFNGKIFSYDEIKIKDFYINLYGNDDGIKFYNTDKTKFNNLCTNISKLPNYKKYIAKYYTELKLFDNIQIYL